MSYLDEYGVKDAKRSKLIRWSIAGLAIAAVLAAVLWFQFRNYDETRQVEAFLESLRRGDHQAAYALWGCTAATPCPQYSFERFMEDWGPNSAYANAQSAARGEVHSCETGIIQTVHFPGKPDVNLWVDNRTGVVGFAPWSLKEVPPGFRSRLAVWMWEVTRNCKPLIQP